MATVERSSQVHANFAHTERSDRQQFVGRIGPWQLVRLLSESELARVYVARPVDAAEDQPANYGKGSQRSGSEGNLSRCWA